MSASGSEIVKTTELPGLRRALERRYEGVTVEMCERRLYSDGHEGQTVNFRALDATVLIGHGLARPDPRTAAGLIIPGMAEERGGGHVYSDYAYVVHHSYDDDPPMPGSRMFPPRKTTIEVERIIRRMRRSARPAKPAQPG